MDKVKVTVQKLNEITEVQFTDGVTSGMECDFTKADNKTIILFNNTSSSNSTVTVKAGNGIQGVVDLDKVQIAGNKMAVLRLDSGAFKHVSGEHKGNVVVVPSATTVKVAVIQLP